MEGIMKETEDIRQLVTFGLGSEEFGIEILSVQEIIRLPEITKVPQAPSYMEGVVNIRGSIVPVMNLRGRIDMERKDNSRETRVIVVSINEQIVGFIVDSVNEVLRISNDIVEPSPDMVQGVDTEYIVGIAKVEKRLVVLLDFEKIFSTNELKKIKQKTPSQ